MTAGAHPEQLLRLERDRDVALVVHCESRLGAPPRLEVFEERRARDGTWRRVGRGFSIRAGELWLFTDACVTATKVAAKWKR